MSEPEIEWSEDGTHGATADGFTVRVWRGKASGQIMVRIDPCRVEAGIPVATHCGDLEEAKRLARAEIAIFRQNLKALERFAARRGGTR